MALKQHEGDVAYFAQLIRQAVTPALPRPHPRDALIGAGGVLLGLLFVHYLLWVVARMTGTPDAGFLAHPMLIAPFGASAVLIFCTPASPLAQPWSVVVGNGLAAICAVAVLQAGLPELVTLGLAATLAVTAMVFARALHPPGGAVAVATVLAASSGPMPGMYFSGVTVVLGSALLVVAGVAFHRVTARSYPFRPAPAMPAAPERRQVASPRALAAALDRLRLGEILGVDDLAHLIETVEESTVSQQAGLTAGQSNLQQTNYGLLHKIYSRMAHTRFDAGL